MTLLVLVVAVAFANLRYVLSQQVAPSLVQELRLQALLIQQDRWVSSR